MKSGLHSKYKTDKAAEQAGRSIVIQAPNEDGTLPTFNIARMGGTNGKLFSRVHAEVWADHKEESALGLISDEKTAELNRAVFVDACLRGWTNVQNEDGSELPYSHANAIALMAELPDLFFTLHAFASEMASYRTRATEAAAKN